MATVDALEDRIAALEAELRDLKRERTVRHDAALLDALATAIPFEVVFNAGEVIAHAALYPDLAAALGAVMPRTLGRRLARVARLSPIAGVALECVGRDERGCIWQIVVTS